MVVPKNKNPAMSTHDIVELIKAVERTPVERDTLYNEIKDFSGEVFEAGKPRFYKQPILNN